MGQSIPLLISGNFKHTGPKFRRINRAPGETAHPLQELLHSRQPQRRTKIAGKYRPLPDQAGCFLLGDLSGFQIMFQNLLAADCQTFQEILEPDLFW